MSDWKRKDKKGLSLPIIREERRKKEGIREEAFRKKNRGVPWERTKKKPPHTTEASQSEEEKTPLPKLLPSSITTKRRSPLTSGS